MVRAALPPLTLTVIAEAESYGYQLVDRLAGLGLEASKGAGLPSTQQTRARWPS